MATAWRWSRSASPRGSEPKYAEAFRDRPAIYPAPAVVRPGKPLVIVEGEFDALLLGQELGDLAAVVTLGIGIGPARGPTYLAMLRRPCLVHRDRRR